MPGKTITNLLVKPAGPDCNMACSYCFYRVKKAMFGQTAAHRMSGQVLDRLIGQLMDQSDTEVAITWQGGEPTLMGIGFYRKAMELIQKYGKGQIVGNGFQTNGLLLNTDWARFFRQYRFLIGLSLDGPRHVHERYRHGPGGAETWGQTVQTAKMLLEEGVAINALIVVNDYSVKYPDEIYDFHKELGLTFMQFIPCVEMLENGRSAAPFSVSPRAYGSFLCKLFDRWRGDFRNATPTTSVRFFEALFYTYVGLTPPQCTLKKECGDYLVVEHNGEVYACDFFVQPEWKLGNVMENRLSDMLNGKKQTRFGKKKAALPTACSSCAWMEHCRGGCPKNRDRQGRNYLCEGLQAFFEYADPHFQNMAARWRTAHQQLG